MVDSERKSREKVESISGSSLTVGKSEVDADSVILEIRDTSFNNRNIMADEFAKLLELDGIYDIWAESDKIYIQVTEEFYN